jgi:hypothetical protein
MLFEVNVSISSFSKSVIAFHDPPLIIEFIDGPDAERRFSAGAGFCAPLQKLCSVIYSALRFFKIFLANGSLISLCLGTVSIAPFLGFIQSECEAPSLFR